MFQKVRDKEDIKKIQIKFLENHNVMKNTLSGINSRLVTEKKSLVKLKT